MKRVLASAGVFAAIMAATTGMAAADADLTPQIYTQQANVGLIAEPSSGSGEGIVGALLTDLAQVAAGSSSKCEGLPPGHCTPYPTA
ncbi:hypothetical protein ACFWPK_32855 [Nocardia sp. NPDC058519]|uniref:hypothetical protein n=1 Tax=Nocardia sp. NPDC058519 TaxID=3346535 RepID=UPI0036586941